MTWLVILYVAATNDNIIRKIDVNGIVAAMAGTGDQDFAGDG